MRWTANLGWMLDNSVSVTNYETLTDPISREVLRFSRGANHPRLRMRYAIDAPLRLGKRRSLGLDPFVAWAWDIATRRDGQFAQVGAPASPRPRSSQWITIGARTRLVFGLHLDLRIAVGLLSPNFEFGPATPPWQIQLGFG